MASWSPRFENVLRSSSKMLGEDVPLDPDTRLFKLGIDSIQIVELIVALEDEFRLDIPQELLSPAAFATPGAIWELLCTVDPTLVDVKVRE
ncbi:acyl carrier protein [Actinocrispum wychmicini]|uniref:Acyl carrier protein n=1 Tax=Actinocrispum wychmicini TaxID=1213861 RepID=A0A4R2JP39_9PSEU|nr:acyl carrier protein [Actinocrispum wychmicini]TCO61911.1 acyl carrier protein [Actinocrispum wychmicini]